MSTLPAIVKLSSSMNGIISAAYSEGMMCLGNLRVNYIHSLIFHFSLSASLHSLYSRTWYQRRNPRFRWVYWRRRGGRARIRRLCWRSIARLPLRPRVPVPICIRSRRPGLGHRQWKESGQVGSIGNSRRHFKREGSPSRIEVIN